MLEMIVYAGDHSNTKMMSILLIVSALVIIGVLIVFLKRNRKK